MIAVIRQSKLAVLLLLGGALLAPRQAVADEGGVSFWLPGQFGSFAAVQGEPGWSLPIVYYHASTDAGRDRLFVHGRATVTGLDVRADLAFIVPTYVFATPVAGAQASLGMTAVVGRAKVGVDATETGPGGRPVSGTRSDTREGVGDLYPTASLQVEPGCSQLHGLHHGRGAGGRIFRRPLANLGPNHWSLDMGGGYTYLDTESFFISTTVQP